MIDNRRYPHDCTDRTPPRRELPWANETTGRWNPKFPVSDSGTTSDGHASTANLFGPGNNYAAYSARLAMLTNHPIKVGAAMPLWREYGGSMWGVQVYNDGSSNVTVDVVWHCELFQTSTAPGSSGWPTAP